MLNMCTLCIGAFSAASYIHSLISDLGPRLLPRNCPRRLVVFRFSCHSRFGLVRQVIMTASLADIFKEEKVHPDLAAELSKVLTIHSFACIASSAEHLEECIKEAVATTLHSLLTPVCIACLKASYHRCLTNLVAPGASAPAQPASLTASSSWTDTFPAKLGNEKVATLRSKFEADYPSEILDASTMPSSRLLASVNKQCQDKRYTYVAWKHRISEEKLEDMHSSRPRKVARFDDFIFDEVPSREIPESGISQMFLLHLLDLVAFAFCLLEAAHLSSFRAYSKLFLKLAFQKQAADSGLRSPNVHEMQWADKEAWRCISDLANSGWSLDDALHEVVQVRCILHIHLQPRAMAAKPRPPLKPPGPPSLTDRNGKGRDNKGKGKGKFKTRNDGPKWCISFMDAGVQKQMCKRWNLRSGCKLEDCTFVHGCAIDVNGKPCGKNHPAYLHKS